MPVDAARELAAAFAAVEDAKENQFQTLAESASTNAVVTMRSASWLAAHFASIQIFEDGS